MEIPGLIKVRQFFNREHIEDIEGKVREEILGSEVRIKPGSYIAIAAGSRGIRNIHRIVKATVEVVKEFGGDHLLFPLWVVMEVQPLKGKKNYWRVMV